MRKTTWWLRGVGTLYLLLTAMNAFFIATSSSTIKDTIPFDVDANGVRAFTDAWLTFILAIAALGVVSLYASTRPAESRMLVLALVVGELLYGVGGDLWLMARGYDVASYVAFTVLHLAIAATGIVLLRTELNPERRAKAGAAPSVEPASAR